MISYRGGFSDRNGIKKINDSIQIERLDQRTLDIFKILIMDIFYVFDDDFIIDLYGYKVKVRHAILNNMLRELYQEDIRIFESYKEHQFKNRIKEITDNFSMYKIGTVFDVIESLVNSGEKFLDDGVREVFRKRVHNLLNKTFEEEYVGYRMIDGRIVSITNEEEIRSINEALSHPYTEINEHLKKALILMSGDLQSRDYENSIKESISSVEATVKIITNNKNSDLKKGLSVIKQNGVSIHPAMQEAFIKLFAYTSDESGIRHSKKIGGKKSTMEDARFMLVACSAFNNFLLSNSK